MPGDRPAFDQLHDTVENQAHRTEDQYGGEGHAGIQRSIILQEQIAKTAIRRDEFSHDGGGRRQGRGYLEAGEQGRQRMRDLDLPEDAQGTGPGRSRQIHDVGIDRSKALTLLTTIGKNDSRKTRRTLGSSP